MGDSFFIQGFRLISSVQAGNQFVRGHDHKASTREIKDQQKCDREPALLHISTQIRRIGV